MMSANYFQTAEQNTYLCTCNKNGKRLTITEYRWKDYEVLSNVSTFLLNIFILKKPQR